MAKELGKETAAEIEKRANAFLGECQKLYDIIGTQIFSIVGLHAKTIFKPMGKNACWGICVVKKNKDSKENIVAINTSFPKDFQVFAAAHELYHVLERDIGCKIEENSCMLDSPGDIKEQKADRFAACLLVNKTLLVQEMDIYKIDKNRINIQDILKLADIFSVPVKCIIKRLYEIDLLTKTQLESFLELSEEEINVLRRRYSFDIPECDEKTSVDGLANKAIEAYNKKRITYDRLSYYLSLVNLKPNDLGIEKDEGRVFLSDEEIDRIMREEDD